MNLLFVRFTVAGSANRPLVINVSHVDAYGPISFGTFLRVAGEEYHVSEAFDVVDAIMHGSLPAAVQP